MAGTRRISGRIFTEKRGAGQGEGKEGVGKILSHQHCGGNVIFGHQWNLDSMFFEGKPQSQVSL